MPKKVTKEINIAVANRKQGYWINEENKGKSERTIKTKGNKVLVKRNRSGYDYDKTITGYEWTKAELDKKLAERAKKGMMDKKAILRDLTHTHRNTKTAPIITASDIFDNDDWNQQDVLDIDTPPGMTLKEIVEKYRAEKKPEVSEKTKEAVKIYPYGAILQLERSGVDLQHLYYLSTTGRLNNDFEIMKILGFSKVSDVYNLLREYNRTERKRLEELKTTKQLKDKNYLTENHIHQAKQIKMLLETKEPLYKEYKKPEAKDQSTKPYTLTKNPDGTLTLVDNSTGKADWVFHDKHAFNQTNKSELKLTSLPTINT